MGLRGPEDLVGKYFKKKTRKWCWSDREKRDLFRPYLAEIIEEDNGDTVDFKVEKVWYRS